MSVPIAQLVKACQRFCFPKGLEFKSQPRQLSFKVKIFDWGIFIAASYYRENHSYNLIERYS